MSAVYLSTTFRNEICDAVAALLGSGTIKFYTGSLPTTVPSDLSGYTLLGTCTFSSTAFGAAVNGTATAEAIADDVSADATGVCGWARVEKSDGTDGFDCAVTTAGGGGAIIINSTSFVEGAAVSVTSFTITMPVS